MKRKRVLCAWALAAVCAMGQQKQQSHPVISRLEIYDLNTKEHAVIKQFIGRIEAN